MCVEQSRDPVQSIKGTYRAVAEVIFGFGDLPSVIIKEPQIGPGGVGDGHGPPRAVSEVKPLAPIVAVAGRGSAR